MCTESLLSKIAFGQSYPGQECFADPTGSDTSPGPPPPLSHATETPGDALGSLASQDAVSSPPEIAYEKRRLVQRHLTNH